MRRLLCILLLFLGFAIHAEDYAARLTPLIDPAKLATLGRRGANPRIQKCVYWLDAASTRAQPRTNKTPGVGAKLKRLRVRRAASYWFR
jgi:hypothetical protein